MLNAFEVSMGGWWRLVSSGMESSAKVTKGNPTVSRVALRID